MLQRMFRQQPLACIFLLCAGLSATDTLTMTDGSQHNGTLVSATWTSITFRERKTLHHYPKSSVQSIEMNTGIDSSPALSRARRAAGSNNVELPTGTEIAVLANQTIDSSTATAGQIFPADVAENVMDAAGRVVIPKGSLAELVLRSASRGGVTSNAEMALDLQSIKVGNRRYVVNTADLEQKAQGGVGANKRTAEMVGGGAWVPLSERLPGEARVPPSVRLRELEPGPGHKCSLVVRPSKCRQKLHCGSNWTSP